MKRKIQWFLSVTLVLLIFSNFIPSTFAEIVNGDFETGDFTGWNTSGTTQINTPSSDPYVPSINRVKQGSYAAQLGDIYSECPGSPAWKSSIWQSAVVPAPPNCYLSFWYAVLAEGSHAIHEAAGFILEVKAGSTVIYHDENEAYDEPSLAPGWVWIGSIAYYDWKLVAYDLSAYAGQTLIINFTVHDCIYCAHAGWGYLDDVRIGPLPPQLKGGGAFASEWAVDTTLLIGVISGLIVAVGIVWLLFKIGSVFERMPERK